MILFGRDRWAISRQPSPPPEPTAPPPRTAILMPIYNEDSERVFAGLRAIHQSLADTGQLDDFDFFILSDTRDPEGLGRGGVALAGHGAGAGRQEPDFLSQSARKTPAARAATWKTSAPAGAAAIAT
ncbi:MAG: hypothetical protein MZV65_47615 [Chromatiales bacterium]|nr:hypothetical protein [Chromatiales bacterium]